VPNLNLATYFCGFLQNSVDTLDLPEAACAFEAEGQSRGLHLAISGPFVQFDVDVPNSCRRTESQMAFYGGLENRYANGDLLSPVRAVSRIFQTVVKPISRKGLSLLSFHLSHRVILNSGDTSRAVLAARIMQIQITTISDLSRSATAVKGSFGRSPLDCNCR